MHDGRLRWLGVICLSLGAFASTGGAVLVILWWCASESHPARAISSRGFLVYGGIITIVAILIQMGGGDGAD
jgi:hypothetical protein